MQLGKALFWEEQVSSDNTVACGTCHLPQFGGTDGRSSTPFAGPAPNTGNLGSFGVLPQVTNPSNPLQADYGSNLPTGDRQVTPVAAPSVIGAYMFGQLFWDMRAGAEFDSGGGTPFVGFEDFAALEALAVEPPLSTIEMGHGGLDWGNGFLQHKLGTAQPLAMVDPATIPTDLAWIPQTYTDYNAAFNAVFAGHFSAGGTAGVTRKRFAMAVAHYQRTLIPDQAPIDLGTMTNSQQNGFQHMLAEGCFNCHSNSGAPEWLAAGGFADPLDSLFSNGQLEATGVFTGQVQQPERKTPTLRNLGLRTKFFSNGLTSHVGLVNFYVGPRPMQSSPLLEPGTSFPAGFPLSKQLEVEDFLFNALTDPRVAAETGPFSRPQLHSETVTFGGNLVGTPTPAAGSTPRMIANVPPLVPGGGAPQWLKIGLHSAAANSATLILFGGSANAAGPVWLDSPFLTSIGPVTNANGIATLHQPVPLTPGLIGLPLYFQWVVDGPSLSYSEAAVLVPFQY